MIEKTFTVEKAPDIDVQIETGRVELREGGPDRVTVSVDTSDPNFTVEQRGSSILISSDKSRSWVARGSAIVVVTTPPGSDFRASVASAEVFADVPIDKAEIKTASSDVELLRGENVVIKTASGDVRLTDIGSALRLSSASGDLFVSGRCNGTIAVSSASGDIRIEEADASLDINTVSGDVHVGRFSGRSANFKSMSGDVSLGIMRGVSVDLDVTLLSGRLRVPDPEPRTEPADRQMSLTAKLVSGDLTVKRVEP